MGAQCGIYYHIEAEEEPLSALAMTLSGQWHAEAIGGHG